MYKYYVNNFLLILIKKNSGDRVIYQNKFIIDNFQKIFTIIKYFGYWHVVFTRFIFLYI